MPQVSSGGVMTHFLRSGHGPEDALLLHCALGHARMLDTLMARMSVQLSMTAMDLPGHGDSADWDRSRDYQEQARDMAHGLLDKPTHLIGHSYGATVALRMAVDHPEMVQSLTLIEPVCFFAASHTAPDIAKAFERKSRAFTGAMAVGDVTTAARAFTADWGTGNAWESLKPAEMDYITSRMPLVVAGQASIVADNGGVWPRLEALQVPVLLIDGMKSAPVIDAIQTALEVQIPNARRSRIEDAGHMLPITHPTETAEVICAFMADQPRISSIN